MNSYVKTINGGRQLATNKVRLATLKFYQLIIYRGWTYL